MEELNSDQYLIKEQEKFVKEILKLRRHNKTLAKFAVVYFYFMVPHAQEQFGSHYPQRGRRVLTTAFVPKISGCSTRAANDYSKALMLMNTVDGILAGWKDRVLKAINRSMIERKTYDVIRQNNGYAKNEYQA